MAVVLRSQMAVAFLMFGVGLGYLLLRGTGVGEGRK